MTSSKPIPPSHIDLLERPLLAALATTLPVEKVREGYTCDGDGKVVHVGEVGLGHPPRQMVLWKEDLLFGAVLGTPEHDATLEGADLAGAIAVRVALAQQVKERFGLERRVALQIGFEFGPVLGEWVGTGTVGARLLEAAG